jgi:hypothetical protein
MRTEPCLQRATWLLCLLGAVHASSSPHHALADRLASSQHVHVTEALSQGRYGHSAAVLDRALLLLGGQVQKPGKSLFITNDVVAVDLSAPVTAKTKHRIDPRWSQHLLPTAWATAVKTGDDVWLLGGVTQDCEADAVNMVLDGKRATWTSVPSNAHTPPRRRQAQAIAIPDKGTPYIYLWGGIADPFTCSLDTVAYMGLDVHNAITQRVATYSWEKLAVNLPKSYKPPISDYAAVPLPDGLCIAFIGGQVSRGELADLSTILVLDTNKMLFTLQVSRRVLVQSELTLWRTANGQIEAYAAAAAGTRRLLADEDPSHDLRRHRRAKPARGRRLLPRRHNLEVGPRQAQQPVAARAAARLAYRDQSRRR